MRKKYLVILMFMFSNISWAKKFTTQYCEFELPPGWECALEGSEWVCSSTNKDRKKEAIIILAAKVRGSEDSLDHYQTYLKKSKNYVLPGGKSQVSDPKYAEIKTIHDHKWVDALHLASEIPGFYTRYLGTVKEDLGVVVTFSVAKDFYNDYQKVIDALVKTLRVFRQKAIAAGDMVLKPGDKPARRNALDGAAGFIPTDTSQKAQEVQREGGLVAALLNPFNLTVALVVIGGLFYYTKVLKKRKKK